MRKLIAIGGGEIRTKTTLEIDRRVAALAKEHAGEKRANALFFGTASHDSMPYFNSFRKTYTSVFDCKADVALLVYGEMNLEKIAAKIAAADCIYVGGGDTVFMLELWKKTGVDKLILDAYRAGTVLCGLSAGAICWFEAMYTDYEIMRGESGDYTEFPALGVLNGLCTPHYDERPEFDSVFLASAAKLGYAIENNCALEFTDETLTNVWSAGGGAWRLTKENGALFKEKL